MSYCVVAVKNIIRLVYTDVDFFTFSTLILVSNFAEYAGFWFHPSFKLVLLKWFAPLRDGIEQNWYQPVKMNHILHAPGHMCYTV